MRVTHLPTAASMLVYMPMSDRVPFRIALATAVAVAWLSIIVGYTTVLALVAKNMTVTSTVPFWGVMLGSSIAEAKPFFSMAHSLLLMLLELSTAQQS